jgi:hypothetical protein
MTRGTGKALAAHEAILALASWLVPRRRRSEWLKEWSGELWYLLNADGPPDACRRSPTATAFCLGAFQDAIWLRTQSARMQAYELIHIQSAIQCVAVLLIITAVAFGACGLPSLSYPVLKQSILAHILVLILALLILPIVTPSLIPVSFVSVDRGSRAVRLRWWTFLGIKLVLLVAAVFLGTFDLGLLISQSGLQPHSALVGYVLAFRWALRDQHHRCPTCLRRLTDPVRIGQPAGTFLEWYGTEFVCASGHGVLHVPELPGSSYSATRWVSLDASWQELFE